MSKRSACGRHVPPPIQWALVTALVAGAVAPAGAAPSTRKGTFHITATVTLGPNAPQSLNLASSVSVNVGDYSMSSGSTSQSLAQSETPVPRKGNVGKVVIDVPYTFVFDSASYPKLKVAVYLAVNNTQASTQSSLYLPIPADGATTPVAFDLAL